MSAYGGNAGENQRQSRWFSLASFLIPIALLLPFLAKPVHVDDPLFIWTAQHIVEHPFDFYGFDVVWMRKPEPMYAANLNPPGVAYYLALVGLLFGWSTPVLHAAMALVAGLAGLGIYRLAQALTPHPLLAVLFAVLTPGFLVSASTIMSDVPLLAAYVWAVVFWRRGLVDPGRHLQTRLEVRTPLRCNLYAAAACASAAVLTKYFGVTLIPLLIVYAIAHRAPWRAWIIPALIPIAVLVAYEVLTHSLYGASHFATASAYSAGASAIGSLSAAANRILITLLFTGGCFLPALLLAPWTWRRRIQIAALIGAVVLAGWWATRERIAYFPVARQTGIDWRFLIHAVAFTLAGLHLAALLVRDVFRKRDPDTMLLFFWGFGTFVFAAFFNHMVSARTVLPFAPVAGLVLARALPPEWVPRFTRVTAGVTIAAAITLTVVAADYAFARAYHQLALKTASLAASSGKPLYFARQWTYQYYLEETGAQPADLMQQPGASAALLAIPDGFTWNIDTAGLNAIQIHRLETRIPAVAALMEDSRGAGYYSHFWGPLPYVFGAPPDAAATIYAVPSESNPVSDALTD